MRLTKQNRPATYGEAMKPLDVTHLPDWMAIRYRDHPLFREWLHLEDRVLRAEKVSSPTEWSVEQHAAYRRGDTAEFSHLRGYTEAEIADHQRSGQLWVMLSAQDEELEDGMLCLYEIKRLTETPESRAVDKHLGQLVHAARQNEAPHS